MSNARSNVHVEDNSAMFCKVWIDLD